MGEYLNLIGDVTFFKNHYYSLSAKKNHSEALKKIRTPDNFFERLKKSFGSIKNQSPTIKIRISVGKSK